MNVDIRERVHELYWRYNVNCARTMLICLSELFDVDIERQTMNSAIGLNGAGRFRAQCGLAEGALMFIGIYFTERGKTEEDIVSICYQYAESFTRKFGSLKCSDLRPNGFSENDPPHLCEKLTGDAVEFVFELINKKM